MKSRFLILVGMILISVAVSNSLVDNDVLNQRILNLITKGKDILISSPYSGQNNETTEINTNEAVVDDSLFVTMPNPDNPTLATTIAIEPDLRDQGFLPLRIEKSNTVLPPSEDSLQVRPVRIMASSIDLDAPVVQASQEEIVLPSGTFNQWSAPNEFAVGWQFDSAMLGNKGNTVLNGHHNVHGKVFENLDKLVSGDRIIIEGDNGNLYSYIVTNVMIFPERDVKIEQRLANARWILPSTDERITLITCWPYYSNSHRLIVVAKPEQEIFRSTIQ